jgi:anaerobic ribonucleoside-triphosphate reductase
VCPICGRPKVDEASRIVGYLVATSTYSKDRKEEYENRKWYALGDDQYI